MLLNSVEKRGPGGHRKRLRDRFARSGRRALADYELLELLLTYAIPRIDTKPIAKELLHRHKTLFAVLQQSHRGLGAVKGLGPAACLFLSVIQACLARCMESEIEERPSIDGPEDLFAYIRLHLGARESECVYALYFDNARHVIHHCQVAEGTVDQSSLYPREVIKPALLFNATGFVLVHNHPSGQPAPSEQDLKITRELEKIAIPMGLTLIDHLVVTRKQAYSILTDTLL